MNPAEKAAVIEKANERRYAISDEKGAEYSGKLDVLRNFKEQGERLALSEVVVLGVYFGKHIDSIETFMRELQDAKSYAARAALVNRGEGLVSRLDDARNYLDLLECLLVELELHPNKIDREAVARHELLELAEDIDWSSPGFHLKKKVEVIEHPDRIPWPPKVMANEGSVVGQVSQRTRSQEGMAVAWRALRRVAGVHRTNR